MFITSTYYLGILIVTALQTVATGYWYAITIFIYYILIFQNVLLTPGAHPRAY